MMIQATDEMSELYDKLMKTEDQEEIEVIRKRLKEIAKEEEEKYKDCPFVH